VELTGLGVVTFKPCICTDVDAGACLVCKYGEGVLKNTNFYIVQSVVKSGQTVTDTDAVVDS
jgi:hypothetical protein